MAYLDLETVRSRRNASIKVYSDNRPNAPIARLRKKIYSTGRIQSKEARDPYIVAVLVAFCTSRSEPGPSYITSQK